jgi:hypothetical protein
MRFLFIFLLGILPGCALLFPDRTAPKSSEYLVTPPPAPWHRLAVGQDPSSVEAMRADMAFEHPQAGAIISLNSICRKYSETSLETLTSNLVRGIGNRTIISRRDRTVAGAKALDTLFEGEVDKVRINIRTVVLAKNDCTYDFIFVSIPRRFAGTVSFFEDFLNSFQAK